MRLLTAGLVVCGCASRTITTFRLLRAKELDATIRALAKDADTLGPDALRRALAMQPFETVTWDAALNDQLARARADIR